MDSLELHNEIRKTWKAMHIKMKDMKTSAIRWQTAHGPIGGLIAALTDVGWKVEEPDYWVTPEDTIMSNAE